MAARRWKHLREQGYRHMNERVIVIGASGHGKVVADIIRRSGDTLLGFLDDNETLLPEITGIPVLGKVADYVKYICPEYCKDCFQTRNEWMVNHSAKVIAVFNGEKGGTANTVKYASLKGLQISFIEA